MKTLLLLIVALLSPAITQARHKDEKCGKDSHAYCGKYDDYSFDNIIQLQGLMAKYAESLKPRGSPVTAHSVKNNQQLLSSEGGQSCVNFYSNLMNRSVIDMRIFFGYKDREDADTRRVFSNDIHMKIALEQFLKRPCQANNPNFYACGFTNLPCTGASCVREDKTVAKFYDNFLIKNIKDPSGNARTLRIGFFHSSLWQNNVEAIPYDVPNVDVPNPAMSYQKITSVQQSMSLGVTRAWENALSQADILIYNGHSRMKGGPDFYPPMLRTDVFSTNYDWYKSRNPTSAEILLQKLQHAGNRAPKLLGLFSCQSQDWFYDDLKNAAPSTAFILNQSYTGNLNRDLVAKSFWYDEPATLVGAINGIAGEFCPGSLTNSMYLAGIDPRSTMKFFPAQYQTSGTSWQQAPTYNPLPTPTPDPVPQRRPDNNDGWRYPPADPYKNKPNPWDQTPPRNPSPSRENPPPYNPSYQPPYDPTYFPSDDDRNDQPSDDPYEPDNPN